MHGNYHIQCDNCLDRARRYQANNRSKDPIKVKLWALKSNAKRRLIPFDLVPEDIVIPEVCPYIGIKLSLSGVKSDNTYSIDRIDNTKGYSKDNIEIVSCLANRMKNSASVEQLITFARAILKRYA